MEKFYEIARILVNEMNKYLVVRENTQPQIYYQEEVDRTPEVKWGIFLEQHFINKKSMEIGNYHFKSP